MRLIPVLLALVLACATPSAPVPPASEAARPPAPTTASLSGVVKAASGEPVEGAVVVLMPVDPTVSAPTPPAGRMRSEAGGRFHFEGLVPGTYALNATAPGHSLVFTLGLVLGAGERTQELTLGPPATRIQGTVRTDDGASTRGLWISVGAISDKQGDEAQVQADAQGNFEVMVSTPGDYWFVAQKEGFSMSGRGFTVGAAAPPRPVELQLQRLAVTTPPPPEVSAWLAQAAVPLTSVEAGHGFADLQPLKGWLAGTRMIALGEATHGTREFFQLKHRMFEFLATEMGFTVFAIEASFGDALAINDYVLTGKGDPAAALAGLHFWTWNTEEVLALIQWMRAYNASPSHPRKLKFYGVDMQFSAASAQALLDYFAKVDPAYREQLVDRFTPLLDERHSQGDRSSKDSETMGALTQELEARLQAGHAAYARKSSEKSWALAARHARVLAQFARGKVDRVNGDLRDQAMAENAQWILDHEGPGTKGVLWAHNRHVAMEGQPTFAPMGRLLCAALGEALYVFGFAFNQGGFQAIDLPRSPQDKSRGLVPHTVPPAAEGSLDAALTRTGLPVLALDVRSAPGQGPVADFLSLPRDSRNFGSVYREGLPSTPTRVRAFYDGLLFVEKTRAAVAMPMPGFGQKAPAPAGR